MKIDWPNWIEQQDENIRRAKGASVRAELRRLNLKKIPRRYLADLADLARRLNLSYLMLRMLTPIIHNEMADADEREETLYAVALARIGAHREAFSILEKIETASKEILFLKGSALQAQWNYRAAKKIYQAITKFKDLNEREISLARLNLSLCQIYLGQFNETIFAEPKFELLKNSYPLLYGNSRELMAQAYLGVGQLDKAESAIRESIDILDLGADDYSLIAKKWLLIITASRTQVPEEDWQKLKAIATQSGDFETLRDLDLHHAILKKDRTEFLKLFFGTPFASFRQKAKKQFGLAVPNKLEVGIGPEKLVVQDGVFLRGQEKIQFSSTQRKLLIGLTRDFYRPIPVGELFSVIYPDERFNIYSSVHRVQQNVQNLRKFLRQENIPLVIQLRKNSYSLITRGVRIEVRGYYTDTLSLSTDVSTLKNWLQSYRKRSFGRREIETELGISRTYANEILRAAEKKKLIRKASAGNKSIYVIFPKGKRVS